MTRDATAAYEAALDAYFIAVQARGDVDEEVLAVVRETADRLRAAAAGDDVPWSVCR